MRETQVHTARVHVDAAVADRLENAVRHRRTLDVPARTTLAPRGLPLRLARLARLPQREVARTLLLRGKLLLLCRLLGVTHHLRN